MQSLLKSSFDCQYDKIKPEILRYLGYGRNIPGEDVLSLVEEAFGDVKKQAVPKCTYRRFPLSVVGEHIMVGGLSMDSRNLSKNLNGCGEAILFAATLGVEIDRLLNRNLKLHISKAAVIQATAAAYIEAYIDECQHMMEQELAGEKLFLRPRFSPGYGDLSLAVQSDFLQVLEAGKRIGLTLSEGGIMLPEKSVTAIMGISSENHHCVTAGCEVCGNTNCAFRRDTVE